VHEVATGHKAFYLVLLLVPFLGLCLLEPLLLLGAVPDLAINLLSNKADQTAIPFHWTAGIVPFVVAASIFGAARFKRQSGRLSLWVLVATACIAVYSPLFSLPHDVRALGSPLVSAKAHALSLLPKSGPVSGSNQLGGHLAERRYSYLFPSVEGSKWIVVDLKDPTYIDAKDYKLLIRRYEASRKWRTVFTSHGIVVLHKRGRTAARG
jgi:uncharacterized membrane protein